MHLDPRIATLLEGLNHPSLPGIDLSLVRMWELLAALGNPQEKLPPVIHIAGTNGKGSTLAFLRAMAEAAGYRVHAYTSPHLVRFNERIVVAGNEIEDAPLLELLQRVSAAAQAIPVTFFEATTAAALLAFSETPANLVLLETGLGGRLDATNVVARPIVTAITPIDFDHMEFLGTTLQAIATEKAGILKPGVPCVLGVQPAPAVAAIATVAAEKNVPLVMHGEGWRYAMHGDGIAVTDGALRWQLPMPTLAGAHQCHNAALASVVARRAGLAISDTQLQAGVRAARWPARLQRLTHGPLVEAWGARGAVMLDGGHNASAARVLRDWIDRQTMPVTLMVGMMARKDAAAFFAPLVGAVAQVIAVPIEGHDSYRAEALAQMARAAGLDAVRTGGVQPGDAPGTLLIAGSLFLAGELLKNHG